MREPEEFRDEMLTHCWRCHDAYGEKIDELEKQNVDLQDTVTDMQDEIERISKERDEAKKRYGELVETVAVRTDQSKKLEQVVGFDPRD